MTEAPQTTNRATPVGDFYVEPDCCLLCGVPESIAPEIFHTGEHHCSVIRQPCSQDEIDRTIRSMWSSEVDCVRYRGRDGAMLERLARAGLSGQTDHSDAPRTPVRLRDQVSFRLPDSANLTDAGEIAGAFRAHLHAEGNKVLPAFLGRRSVWVSWFQNRFHLVRFADAGEGRFAARLRSTVAMPGLAWLVDDWLRTLSVKDLRWEVAGDPTSARTTPM